MQYLVTMDYFVNENPVKELAGHAVNFLTKEDSTPNEILMAILQNNITPTFTKCDPDKLSDLILGIHLGQMLANDDVTLMTDYDYSFSSFEAAHKLTIKASGKKQATGVKVEHKLPAEEPIKEKAPEKTKAKKTTKSATSSVKPVVETEYVDCTGEYDKFPEKVRNLLEHRGLLTLLEKESMDKDYVAHQVILALKLSSEPAAFKIQLRSFVGNPEVSQLTGKVIGKPEFYNMMHDIYAFSDK